MALLDEEKIRAPRPKYMGRTSVCRQLMGSTVGFGFNMAPNQAGLHDVYAHCKTTGGRGRGVVTLLIVNMTGTRTLA